MPDETTPPTEVAIRSRVPMAEPHILAAALLRDHARDIEVHASGGMRPQRKRAYIGAAVVEAQAFAETFINSFYWEALDGVSMGAPGSAWNLGTDFAQALAAAWRKPVADGKSPLEKLAAERKYQEALRIAGKETIDEHDELLVAARLRRQVRNALIHEGARFRVTHSTIDDIRVEEAPWERELRALAEAGTFRRTPTSHPQGLEERAFFPDQLLSSSFAHWCIRTAIGLHDEFRKRLGFGLRDLSADRTFLMPPDFDGK